jgi:hypothetical protein
VIPLQIEDQPEFQYGSVRTALRYTGQTQPLATDLEGDDVSQICYSVHRKVVDVKAGASMKRDIMLHAHQARLKVQSKQQYRGQVPRFMSGGHNGGTCKGKHDIVPVARASFLAAIKALEQRQGKTPPELMTDWLAKDPIALSNAISKFLPREERVHVAHDHAPSTASLHTTCEFIASVVDQESVSVPSKAIHNRPVVVVQAT